MTFQLCHVIRWKCFFFCQSRVVKVLASIYDGNRIIVFDYIIYNGYKNYVKEVVALVVVLKIVVVGFVD